VLGVALLNEPVRWSTGAGFLLVVAGCWMSTRPSPAPAERPAEAVAAVRD
jgi:drug/metabolite transporter (DMT)-like permease